MELQIYRQYPLVVTAVNSGTSVDKAVLTTGISRSSFFKYRSWIAEIKIVKSQQYEQLREQFTAVGIYLASARRLSLTRIRLE
jgi:ACT domain-containing protein